MNNDLSDITGVASGFDDRNLCRVLTEAQLKELQGALRVRFRKTKLQPDALEVWMVRCYSSVKLLLAATVILSSSEYARGRGLKIVIPYLIYYACFNVSRAFLLLIPEQPWNDGRLLDHSSEDTERGC
jgi:hypothetical protein